VRRRFFRQPTHHSTLLAPCNVLMRTFSCVPNTAYLDLGRFPELAPLAANWQVIRDEALLLFADGHIRAPRDYIDIGLHSFFQSATSGSTSRGTTRHRRRPGRRA